SIDQQAALEALENKENIQERMITILSEKNRVIEALEKSDLIEKIYPSDTNFLLVKVANAPEFYQQLLARDIIVRNQHNNIKNTLRITIGKAEENDKLIQALEEMK